MSDKAATQSTGAEAAATAKEAATQAENTQTRSAQTAEEVFTAPEVVEGATTQADQTNWKEYAQKWEKRAKENLKELEKVQGENAKFKAAQERNSAVATVAEKTGLPAQVINTLGGTNEEELLTQAQYIAQFLPQQQSAPVVKTEGANVKVKDELSDVIDNIFRA
nr:MAG TPA: hypothetical protein [Caudoviricetes sp.]